ncbi:hypothetical protein K9L97_05675 [Candidatus Woesearchaeota archaeon]|nr:hypothetical protein [Candidatus Woesearchaeota archaeon]
MAIIERFLGQTHILIPKEIKLRGETLAEIITEEYKINKNLFEAVILTKGPKVSFIYVPIPGREFKEEKFWRMFNDDIKKYNEQLKKDPKAIHPNWYYPENLVKRIYELK